MASFAVSVTNSVRAFGMGPSTKWGQSLTSYTMNWGTAKWGEGLLATDTINNLPKTLEYIRVISNTATFDPVLTYSLISFRTISNDLTLASDISYQSLFDGTGLWNYVFTGNTINADSSTSATWGSATTGAVVYTSGSVSTTTWSSL